MAVFCPAVSVVPETGRVIVYALPSVWRTLSTGAEVTAEDNNKVAAVERLIFMFDYRRSSCMLS